MNHHRTCIFLFVTTLLCSLPSFATEGPIRFCNLPVPIAPLHGDKQSKVQEIRAQIDWGRREIDAQRSDMEAFRGDARDGRESEHARLDFEQDRQCFEHWREDMENLRAHIESREGR